MCHIMMQHGDSLMSHCATHVYVYHGCNFEVSPLLVFLISCSAPHLRLQFFERVGGGVQ